LNIARQLKLQLPELSVAVIDRMTGSLLEAAHKVVCGYRRGRRKLFWKDFAASISMISIMLQRLQIGMFAVMWRDHAASLWPRLRNIMVSATMPGPKDIAQPADSVCEARIIASSTNITVADDMLP